MKETSVLTYFHLAVYFSWSQVSLCISCFFFWNQQRNLGCDFVTSTVCRPGKAVVQHREEKKGDEEQVKQLILG